MHRAGAPAQFVPDRGVVLTLRIAVLAGEASGDQLGAAIVAELKKGADIELMGVGGPLLAAEGLSSLFDYTDLSVMGLTEVLPRLPKLLARIDETVRAVAAFGPDVVVTVDAPDFSKRVVKRLRNANVQTKFVHAVAPTVWAWRPGRAKTFAKLFDRLLCLLPFEPPYFEAVGLKADFIGHPALESIPARVRNDPQTPVHMLILPGSRRQEIDKLLPVFCDTIQWLKEIYSQTELKVFSLTLPHLYPHVQSMFAAHGIEADIRIGSDEKGRLLADADIAIAASGTMGLELALAGVPHVIAYRMNPITYAIVKSLARTPYAHLANILLKREAVPELIQGDATAQNIAEKSYTIMVDDGVRMAQMAAFQEFRGALNPGASPAQLAALSILDAVRLPIGS